MDTKKNEMQDTNQQEQKEVVYTKTAQFTVNLTRGVLFTIICTVITLVVSLLVTNLYTPNWVEDLDNKVNRLGEEKSKNTLLLVGSGTVHEYLKDKDSTLLKNIVSMPIPTLPALKALREEKQPQQGNNLSWIIMSGMDAGDSLIMDEPERNDFYEKIGAIVRLYLIDDALTVFVHPKTILEKQGKKYITVEELRALLAKQDSLQFQLFKTSVGSATRTLFEEALGPQISKKPPKFFDMTTTAITDFRDSRDKDQFVILGSNIYGLKDKKLLENCNSYILINNDKEKKEIKKSLYLYFTAYWKDVSMKEKGLYLMPQTEAFVKRIEPNFDFDRHSREKLIIDAKK